MFRFTIRDLLWLTVVVAVALFGAINYYRLLETHKRLINEREKARREELALTRKWQQQRSQPIFVPRGLIRDMYPQPPGPPRPRLNDVLLDSRETIRRDV